MSGKWAKVLFAVAIAINLLAVYAPSTPGGAPAIPNLDKAVHILVFALVAWTGRRAGVPARWLIAGLIAHAVASELVQHFLLPGRSGDPWDVLADCAGVLLGMLIPAARFSRSAPSAAGVRENISP